MMQKKKRKQINGIMNKNYRSRAEIS
jgi:hypothetical protein